jgi:hypothetical protein
MATKKHALLPGSRRKKDPHAIRVGTVDPKQRITVTIGLSGPKLPGPDEYIGQTLMPEQFAEKFSAPKAAAEKVAASLKKFGLKVEDVNLEARSMQLAERRPPWKRLSNRAWF